MPNEPDATAPNLICADEIADYIADMARAMSIVAKRQGLDALSEALGLAAAIAEMNAAKPKVRVH